MDHTIIQFNNNFFYQSLLMKPINDMDFSVQYFVIDSRNITDPKKSCFIAIKGPNYDANNFFEDVYRQGVKVFILERYPTLIPKDAIIFIVKDSIATLAKMAQIHKKNLCMPHLMITGSFGKTTTRLMIAQALNYKYPVHTAKKNWNNTIGLPLTILETPLNTKISILEAGMSSKGEIKALSEIVSPDISIITNVGHSHMESFSSLDDIAKAKIEIVEGMKSGSLLIINKNDPYRILFESFAKGDITYFDKDDIIIKKDMELQGFYFSHKKFPGEEFFSKIPGEHLKLNLSILFLCAEILQLPIEYIHRGLESDFSLLENRMNVFEKNGITVIADSYNASLESFESAFQVFSKAKGRKIAVIADILELGLHTEAIHCQLGDMIEFFGTTDHLLAFGSHIKHTCQQFQKTSYTHYESLEFLQMALQDLIKKGDTILIKGSNGMGLSKLVNFFKAL